MTVAVETRRIEYEGNGLAVGPYPVDFPFFELAVYVEGVLIDPSDYTITQAAVGGTGDVTFDTAPTGTIKIVGDTNLAQTTDFISANEVDPEVVELSLDKISMALQEMNEVLDRDYTPGFIEIGELVNVTPAADDKVVLGDTSDDDATRFSTVTQVFTAGKTAASETATGVVELATSAEAVTGSDTARAVTPAGLKAHVDGAIGAINQPTVELVFIIDGGGSTITTGQKGHLLIPFNATITKVTTLADQTGSIVVDIWKDTYANFPPTGADSITASAKPTISSGVKAQDAVLTGWTKTITAGDILAYNVDSVTTIRRATVTLTATKTS